MEYFETNHPQNGFDIVVQHEDQRVVSATYTDGSDVDLSEEGVKAAIQSDLIVYIADLDAVAEWVGLHYGVNFAGLNSGDQRDWISRFNAATETKVVTTAAESDGNDNGTEDDFKFTYMMLSRLQHDMDYYLGCGNRSNNALYYANPEEHIAEMRKLFESLPAAGKPEWLTWNDINDYEKQCQAAS